MLVIPYPGYLPHFARSPLGFIILIVIPGVLIIINEVWNIARIKKEAPKKNKVKQQINFTTNTKSKEKRKNSSTFFR